MKLIATNVSKQYGRGGNGTETHTNVVFSDFNLEIQSGQIIALVGKSGTGKSTLLKMMAGLLLPDSGSIKFQDTTNENLYHCSAVGQNMTKTATLVFQEYDASLLPWQRVKVAINWGYMDNEEQRASVIGAITETLGINDMDLFERYPHQLSGGQKQKVAVARALVRKPKLLLMDEPFGSLDAFSRYELESLLLKEWQNENGLTVVIATHDLEEAVFLAHRVVVVGGSPCQVKGIVDVALPIKDRSEAFKESAAFAASRRAVRELLAQ